MHTLLLVNSIFVRFSNGPFKMKDDHWVLWQVGGPRGNATQDYLAAWEKVRAAFEDYAATTRSLEK